MGLLLLAEARELAGIDGDDDVTDEDENPLESIPFFSPARKKHRQSIINRMRGAHGSG